MSAFLKKAYLVVMVGVVGIIILAAVIQQGKVSYMNLSASQKEIGNKTRAVPVDGPEGDVPQKLLKELSSEGR